MKGPPLPRTLHDERVRIAGEMWGRPRTLGMPVAERRVTHVRKLDVTFRARIHEYVALSRVELGGSNDLCQFLHVRRLDVDDVFPSVSTILPVVGM